jgi:hypothetical protein
MNRLLYKGIFSSYAKYVGATGQSPLQFELLQLSNNPIYVVIPSEQSPSKFAEGLCDEESLLLISFRSWFSI